MQHFQHPVPMRKSIRGFSLIELMVSLTIGLVIVTAALSAYLGSSGASKMSEAQARMNDDAQAALNLLTSQLKLAEANPAQPNRDDTFRRNPVFAVNYVGGSVKPYGATTAVPAGVVPVTTQTYPATAAVYTLSAFSIRGCDGKFTDITTAANLTNLTCTAGATTAPDSIAISYEADRYNTTPTTGATPNKPTDCVGSRLNEFTSTLTSGPTASATFSVADNRFYVANSAAGIPNLYCKGSASGTQPLVENVEDLQLAYGLVKADSTSATDTVAGYLSANEFADTASLVALADDAARWGRVMSVQICVVVRSADPILTETASGAFYKCDGTLDTTKTDRRFRRAYTTTVVLRNRHS